MRTPRLRFRLRPLSRVLSAILAAYLFAVTVLVGVSVTHWIRAVPHALLPWVIVGALLATLWLGLAFAWAAWTGVDLVTTAPAIPARFLADPRGKPAIPASRVLPDSDPELSRLIELAPIDQPSTITALRSYLQHLVREGEAAEAGLRSGRLVLWRGTPDQAERLKAHVVEHLATRTAALARLEERVAEMPAPADR